MREIIEYLLTIEKTAGDLYKDASVFFKQDTEFARFLSRLSEDEASHFDAMVSAAEYFVGKTEEASAFISLDNATKKAIERPLTEIREKLITGDLTKDAMISCVVTAESSEWNYIFLYVVNTLRNRSPEFGRLAAEIQQHKERIEAFVASMPGGHKHLERIRRLPNIWWRRILIVEDDSAVAKFLSIILEREGIVETVEDGEKGLRKITEQYFDVIVSDLDMPIMNGIEFYEKATRKDNSIGERFLFLTGHPSPENVAFFAKYNLRYMTKPANIDKIKAAVRDLIHGTTKHH